MNKKGKYTIRIKGGKILDSCRNKIVASRLREEQEKMQWRTDIIIEKAKEKEEEEIKELKKIFKE